MRVENTAKYNICPQGLDSWFVPAFSAIADSTALLNHVIPPDQGFTKHENYCGIFHFRFWFGRWIEIVVDDRLPVKKDAPLYMKVGRLRVASCPHT